MLRHQPGSHLRSVLGSGGDINAISCWRLFGGCRLLCCSWHLCGSLLSGGLSRGLLLGGICGRCGLHRLLLRRGHRLSVCHGVLM